MRFLIIGGTRFVGRHIAEHALMRGHDVTVFHRGQTGADVLADATHVFGDRDKDLGLLGEGTWDVTVDACAYVPRQVDELADALGGRGGRHVFISTVSVYAEPLPPNSDEGAPLATLDDPTTEVVDEHTYGGLKVLCEQAVGQHHSDALVIRPTYVVGPHDYTHRFTYWIERVADGGRVLAPAVQDYGIQFIDARDQARWVCELVERGETGTYHTVSPTPPFTFGDMIRTIVDAVAPTGTTIEWVDPAFLLDQGVDDSALPLWVPTLDPDPGMACDPSHARAHGLTTRTLSDTIRETLAHERQTPTPNPGGTGWSRDAEVAMLAAWDAR